VAEKEEPELISVDAFPAKRINEERKFCALNDAFSET